MILKGQDILGKPITTEYGERVIDDIGGVIVDTTENQVTALYFNEYSLFSSQAIPFSAIRRLSKKTIKVYSTSDLRPLTDFKKANSILINSNLHFKKLFSPDGLQLGYMYDLSFETSSGKLQSYEVIIGSNIQNRWQLSPHHLMKTTPTSVVLTEEASQYILDHKGSATTTELDRISESSPTFFNRIQATLKTITS